MLRTSTVCCQLPPSSPLKGLKFFFKNFFCPGSRTGAGGAPGDRRRRRRRRTIPIRFRISLIPIRFRFAARLLSIIPPEKTATTERRRTKRRSPFFSLLLLASDRSSRRKSNTNPAACFPSCFLPRTTTPRVLWGDRWYHLRFWK